MRSGLVAIRQPAQICRPCAVRHAANSVTRNARLRSWMEGWRITCPICGTELEDFRPYTRLFRADPADPLLVQIRRTARHGEQIVDRACGRHGDNSAHAALMRSLLSQQVPGTMPRRAPGDLSRLLDLVVPVSNDFFRRLAPEIWPSNSRILPLSVRIPVLAGVAEVSSCPEYWGERLSPVAAAPPHQVRLLRSLGTLAAYDYRAGPAPATPSHSHLLRQ